jgi:hypothetical protein
MRRGAVDAPLTALERESYLKRLQKEGNITEAYLVWVNGLSREERRHLGLVYNGSFELEPSNAGFDWYLNRSERATIRTGSTFGVSGEKALHLLFKNHEGRFRHVVQPLFLDPGHYRVTGRVRTDSLETRGGLKWVVRCRSPQGEGFGESGRFLGSNEWREFSFEIQVPETCNEQEIRLQSSGERLFEHKMTGGAWFDSLAISRIRADGAQEEARAASLVEVIAERTRSLSDAEAQQKDAELPVRQPAGAGIDVILLPSVLRPEDVPEEASRAPSE